MQQVPDFVRADYPTFVAFIQAYYKWFEDEYSLLKLENLVDIDDTLADFLRHFRKSLDIEGITANTEDRFYIKHLKELYVSKGSSAAFQFLFSLLYSKPSKVIEPWNYAFIPSEAHWKQEFSIIVNITAEEAALLNGQEITLIDEDGNEYLASVDFVAKRPDGRYELFVQRLNPKAPIVSLSYTSGETTITETLEPTTESVSIIETVGDGFEVGTVYDVVYGDGVGTSVRVAKVSSTGALTGVEIVTFGTGYPAVFDWPLMAGHQAVQVSFFPKFNALLSLEEVYLKATVDSGIITADPDSLTADLGNRKHPFSTGDAVYYNNGDDGHTSIGGLTNDAVYYVINIDESTLQLATSYANAIAGTEINLTSGATGNGHTLTLVGATILRFEIGGVAKYPGHYGSKPDVLGDGCYIEDSEYYQVYSYVTAIEELLAKYEGMLHRVLHPSGTKHFAQYTLLNDFSITLEATLELGLEYPPG